MARAPWVRAAVTSITVTCSANTYTVGGTITGLNASGLVLLDNGGDATTISTNAHEFTMNTGLAYGSTYAITVQTQPGGLACSVSNGTGTVGAADVTSVSIACVSNTTILHFFAGGSSDGVDPYAGGLILGSDGKPMERQSRGGRLRQWHGLQDRAEWDGDRSVLPSRGGADGANPYAGLILGGTAISMERHSTERPPNNGVFKITPSGTETVLYSLHKGGSSDGANQGPAA